LAIVVQGNNVILDNDSSVPGSLAKPVHRFSVVLWYALTLAVHEAKGGLGIGVPPLGKRSEEA
jgi:hypothetical protein